MLDADLAEVYGVETRVLVQAVKRNSRRFPSDFIFQLSALEWDSLRSQIVISKGKGGRRYHRPASPAGTVQEADRLPRQGSQGTLPNPIVAIQGAS